MRVGRGRVNLCMYGRWVSFGEVELDGHLLLLYIPIQLWKKGVKVGILSTESVRILLETPFHVQLFSTSDFFCTFFGGLNKGKLDN
ncbi:hypothetical protein XELAEV_18037424mg [Xenopus laevis]|uniref:Uncharacterized protein n=1 Tax=Xenopus laevis TaxID=8355 RepID=A0A974HA64_XENLA|nr:hypothetical protein XELAEV_18037424mg [Xenopus laevis]